MRHFGLLSALLLFAVVAMADEPVLYFNNVDGTTSLVYINDTDEPIVADFAPLSAVGFPGRFGTVPPRDFVSIPFDLPGSGVRQLAIAPGLRVETEFRTRMGAPIRIPPLRPVGRVTLYNLLNGDGWNSGVIIAALEPTVARVVGGGETLIPSGGAVILPALTPVIVVENRLTFGTQGQAPIYVFAYSNHATTYTLLRIE